MKFKPGLYYIGDPCYCFGWPPEYERIDWRAIPEIWYRRTSWGDGTYQMRTRWGSASICVDSGSIGVVPFDKIQKMDHTIGRCGQLVYWTEEWEASRSDGGVFMFQTAKDIITINTEEVYG